MQKKKKFEIKARVPTKISNAFLKNGLFICTPNYIVVVTNLYPHPNMRTKYPYFPSILADLTIN
jgi:hypothetical protein